MRRYQVELARFHGIRVEFTCVRLTIQPGNGSGSRSLLVFGLRVEDGVSCGLLVSFPLCRRPSRLVQCKCTCYALCRLRLVKPAKGRQSVMWPPF